MFFPLHCPVCDSVVVRKKGLICPECISIPRLVEEPRCVCCSKHLQSREAIRCRDCSGLKRHFERGIALYEYASVHDSIHAFKNMGRADYAHFYGEEMRRELMPTIRGMKADALVPIPLHPGKLNKRGYNQAALLAGEISKGCGVPVREDILKRVRKTEAQKKMNHESRQNNMKKAFHMVKNDVKLKTIILVDDVFTTGSTLEAAAEELKRGGVEKVYFVALAIGKGL
ncbi:MAG: ComF family protein [Lachnospiraceae bacterium]|nr:ComF family protein [Lachnospiraceae bacterium]